MGDKVAIVTGAGRGIGRSIARVLAQNGYCVAINYNRSADGAEALCRELTDAGHRAGVFQADVSQVPQVDGLIARVLDCYGRLDLMVNNAGVTKFAPFLEVTEELWDFVFDTDLKSAFFGTQRAAAAMVRLGIPGVVVNIASNQGIGCWPRASVYGPAKAAMIKFTKHAALELGKHRIRVNAIAPGYTTTDVPRDVTATAGPIARIPLRTMARSEEIGHAVLYLASEQAFYITGTTLQIDGGALLPVLPENEFV